MKGNKTVMKREGVERNAHNLHVMGIIWICLGVINPVFLILGIVFLCKAAALRRDIEKGYTDQPKTIVEPYRDMPSNKTVSKKFCTNCGMQLDFEDFFCFACGERSDL